LRTELGYTFSKDKPDVQARYLNWDGASKNQGTTLGYHDLFRQLPDERSSHQDGFGHTPGLLLKK